MVKPMPSLPPLLLWIAVLMPITSPSRFTSGPPLLPGLMAASVCRKSSRAASEAASLGADDAGRNRARQSKGLAEGHNPVADFQLVAIAEPGRRQVARALQTQHGQVALRIGLNVDRLELPSVLQARP